MNHAGKRAGRVTKIVLVSVGYCLAFGLSIMADELYHAWARWQQNKEDKKLDRQIQEMEFRS